MTAFTLDLPDELAERLAQLPKAELNAYAVSVFTPLVQTDEDDLDLELDADTIAAIRKGWTTWRPAGPLSLIHI